MDEPENWRNRFTFLFIPTLGSAVMAALGYRIQTHISPSVWLQGLEWVVIAWSYIMAVVLFLFGLRLSSGRDN